MTRSTKKKTIGPEPKPVLIAWPNPSKWNNTMIYISIAFPSIEPDLKPTRGGPIVDPWHLLLDWGKNFLTFPSTCDTFFIFSLFKYIQSFYIVCSCTKRDILQIFVGWCYKGHRNGHYLPFQTNRCCLMSLVKTCICSFQFRVSY
jgi:hypothetical protein